MTMTPQDIQSQQFHVRFRGFDVEEVDAFLERVAEELLVLIQENKQLGEQVEALKKEIGSYHHQEKAFQSAIISAQQIAEEMKAKSRRAAEEITAAAREEAGKLREQANTEVAELEAELDRLRGMKRQASQEMRQMLRSYLERLEDGEEEMPAPAAARIQSPKPPVSEPARSPESPSAAALQASAPISPRAIAEPASATEAPVVDLSDLYEKIELTGDEFAPLAAPRLETGSDGNGRDPFAMGMAEEAEESIIPDLEGDMLFTLEDPLDDEGPAVSFDDEPEGRGKGRR